MTTYFFYFTPPQEKCSEGRVVPCGVGLSVGGCHLCVCSSKGMERCLLFLIVLSLCCSVTRPFGSRLVGGVSCSLVTTFVFSAKLGFDGRGVAGKIVSAE